MAFLYNLTEYNIETYFATSSCYRDSGIDIITSSDVDQ